MYGAFSRNRLKATKCMSLKQQLLVKSLVSTLAEHGRGLFSVLSEGFLCSIFKWGFF